MGQCYLLGGDTWHRVTWTDRLCQSFRPQSDFILQYVDIIEKHNWWDDPPKVDLYRADINGHPTGDRISRGQFQEVPYSFTSPLWVFAESWGKTLTENHLWWPGPPEQNPEVTLKNGIVTLVNPGYTSSHIGTIPDHVYPPLVSDYGNHLYVHHHAPLATGHPESHWISYAFITGILMGENWYLEAVISHGTNWAPIETCGATPLGSCFEEGKGPHIFDLTAWWIFCRTCHELPNDPSDWVLKDIMLLVEDPEARPGTTLSNSYLSIARRKFEPPPYDDYPIQVYTALEGEIKHRAHYLMSPVQLLSGGHYALVIRHRAVWPPEPADILYDKGDATYPVGHMSHSDDRGETWTDDDDDDVCFAAYGLPPAPLAPPVAPVGNIAFLDIQQTNTPTGYEIVVTTDVPCHLYMMWTKNKPIKHKIVGLRRGDLSLRETRQCFTGWHKNEQEEAGDTLTHTFIKEPWPVCETRWFTFRGKMQSLWSASSSPIFKKHRPSPPITRYFYSDAHPEEKSVDGYTGRGISVPCELWPVLRAGPGTFGEDESRYFEIQIMAGKYTPKWCRLYRIIMLFDTSEIPEGSTILNAKLSLDPFYRKEIEAWPLFSMVVVKSFPDSNTGLVPADYHHLAATILSNVILVSEDPVDGKYVFIFNTTGKYAVIPGGITKLGLRDFHYDCLNHEPPWARFYQARVQFEAAESPYEARRPCLEVTYLPPA